MIIRFNESVHVPANKSHINETNMDVYIEVSEDRRLEEGFNASQLNLTWRVETFQEKNMTMQLNFTEPL